MQFAFDAFKHSSGVIHIIGRHLPEDGAVTNARIAYAECGIVLLRETNLNGSAWFLQPNIDALPTCIACLVTSRWGTYAPY